MVPDAGLFGYRVAVSENVVVTAGIGAKNGVVYLFTKEGEFIERIDAPDDEAEGFGIDVSIEGNRLLVGAFNSTAAEIENAGAAYLYLI